MSKNVFSKKLFSFLAFVLIAGFTFGQPAVFFSEYIEGGGNNKALEIYNGTGATIDLSQYLIIRNVNGGAWPQYIHTLSGSLTSGDVYVFANSSANSAIQAVADFTDGAISNFNGDDARAIVVIDPTGADSIEWTSTGDPGFTYITILDIIGVFGYDPGSGWDVAGVANATANHTLVRKPYITAGNTDWVASAGTDSINSQWLVYPQDEVSYLGAHTVTGPATADVTLNVNMTYQTTLANFNPLTDFVDVAGSFNSWAGTTMTDTDGDNIWTAMLTGQTVGAVLEYKFRINGTSYESFANNRTFTVASGTNTAEHWYNDDAGPQDVTFTIVDGTAAYLDIEMKGSFDSWTLHQMYDDGTNGDVASGDHTWTLTMSIPGGSWEWGAIENDGSSGGLWLIDGGNPAFTVSTSGMVTGQTEYEIPAPGAEEVIFCVSMQQQIALGNFNATTDFVVVAGNFNSFGGSAAMDDTDGDGIYCITVGGFHPSDVAEFKFRKNGTDWEGLANNRTYTVIGGGVDSVIYWFNNEALPAPTGVFFSEYIEGSGNNKALEIYNGTGALVNLDDYMIAQATNGGGWSNFHNFPTGATLAAGEVWVIITNQTDTNLFSPANADEVMAYPSVVHHNGDDARAVCYLNGIDYTIVDLIGDPNNDPGSAWPVAGVSNATANYTLVRKGSVLTGTTDWLAAAGSDSLNSEWIVFPQNTFEYLGSHPNNFTPMEDLTVNVNMSYQATLSNFDPANDTIYVLGTLDGWVGTEMTDPDGDSIYTVIFPDLYVGSMYEYKFRINSGNWETVNNREYTMATGTNEVTHWFNNMSPPYDVLFTIIDGTQSFSDINLKSDFDGWNWHQMYDDGTNGDVTSGDNTWSLLLNVPGGSWQWGAIEDDGSLDGLWLIDGANPVFTLNPDGTVTGQTSYEIPVPGSDSVQFNVNMNYQITLGNFDPINDFVYVAGSFNGYGSSGAMDDTDGDGIYSIWIDGFTAAAAIEFKFRINGTGWETMPGNRTYTVIGGGVDVYTAWFNNAEPPPPNTLFFSEYIEGSSNNKALEIYNNTGATVNLDEYRIAQSVNGGGWAHYHTFPVGATLGNGDVWVMVTNQVFPSLYDTSLANEVLSYPSVVHHNGDDARAIIKIVGPDTIFVDIFGNPDNDPGTAWPVAGINNATANHTLVRKATVVTGNTDWLAAFGTNATNSEWKVLDIDEFDYLGFHPHVFDSIADVTFNVNMSQQQFLGNFDPLVDFVDVAGTMNGFASGDVLTDANNDMIYTITFDSVPVGTVWEFKFRINGSWSDLTCEFPYGGPNRSYEIQDGVNEVDYWYNDVQPAPVVTIYDIQYTTDPSGDSPYNGGMVETSGLVTAIQDTTAYFIQSGNGMWNGVYVYHPNSGVALGDHVTLVGEVDEYYNLTEIKNIVTFNINSSGNSLPPAASISTFDMASEEAYEGVLIKVVSATCTNANLGYGEWQLNDGTGPCVADDVIFAYAPDLGHVYDVTGVVYYSFNEYKLQPRNAMDIQDVTVFYDVQTLNLVSGWSMFSTYIDPFEANLDSVFSPIVSQVQIVKDGGGAVYWPQFNVNAIGSLTLGKGYQIKMLAAQSLDIIGTAVVPETTPFTILQGWSIIGYLRNSPANIATIFSSIVADVIIMKNGIGQVYWPLWNVNAIGNMMPGEGYQANMIVSHVFSYPANGPLNQTSKSVSIPMIFNTSINTGSNMTLGIPVSAWENTPSVGSEIAVYNQAGELCGSTVCSGKNLAIAIWGDDETTPEAEAMQEGDAFSIKIWDQQTKQESIVVVEAWESGNGLYGKNAIAVASRISNEGSILQNYPNPATTYTEIEFSISEDGFTSLVIYNILGEQMAMPVNQTMTIGTYKVLVNTESYVPGVYFYTLKTSKSTITKSMQVIK